MRFSANLGMLWADLPLVDAIHAAHKAGFDAVECHWPYDTDPRHVKQALNETSLPMLGLNTRRGDIEQGEFGLAALPDRVTEARVSIDEALEYARDVQARSVHVMAGIANGDAAEDCFCENLTYACKQAQGLGLSVLIEVLNSRDVAGYFLTSTKQALRIVEKVNQPNLKLMFDIYHEQINSGDVLDKLVAAWPHVGHIQFASAPDRLAPDDGDEFFETVFEEIERLGWSAPLGAEYKVFCKTEETLSWLSHFKNRTGA